MHIALINCPQLLLYQIELHSLSLFSSLLKSDTPAGETAFCECLVLSLTHALTLAQFVAAHIE